MSEASRSISTATAPTGREPSRGRRMGIAITVIVAVIVGGGGAAYFLGGSSAAEENLPTAVVLRGPMRVTVVETGEVKADKQLVVRNELNKYSAVIKELAPEGEQVAPGDLIIRLESQELEDEVLDQEMLVRTHEDALLSARNNALVKKKKMAAQVRAAQQALEDTVNNLKKYMGLEWWEGYQRLRPRPPASTEPAAAEATATQPAGAEPAATQPAAATVLAGADAAAAPRLSYEGVLGRLEPLEGGEWRQQRDESIGNIEVARSELALARDKLNSKIDINSKPELQQPYSKSEIEAERVNVSRLALALERAKTDNLLLRQYTHPRNLRDRLAAIEDAEGGLKTAMLEAETEIKIAETAQDTAALQLSKQRRRLADLRAERAKLKVVAKERGLVVYESRPRRWDRPITVAVDERISPGQQLMILPDMSTLQIETYVFEAVQEQVKPALPVLIRLDAKKGQVFPGKVWKVAPMPDSQNPWLSPTVKVYQTIAKFDEIPGNLRPGMNCEVEIILGELENVLSVPIAAVFTESNRPYCWRVRGRGKPEQVYVKPGRISDKQVQILEGLSEGEEVLMAPPSGVSAEAGGKPPKEKEESPAEPSGGRGGGGGNGAAGGAPAAKTPARGPAGTGARGGSAGG